MENTNSQAHGQSSNMPKMDTAVLSKMTVSELLKIADQFKLEGVSDKCRAKILRSKCARLYNLEQSGGGESRTSRFRQPVPGRSGR